MRTGPFRLAAIVCLVLAGTQASCKKKKAGPDDLQRGMELFNAGMFDHAIIPLSAHLRRNPTDAEAFANRGVARTAVNDFDGALADFEVALRLNPGFARVHVLRGNLRKKRGDPKGALEDFDDAIGLDPENAPVHYSRANIRTDRGDLDGAIADYTVALRMEPENAQNHFNRGIAYYLRKDWEKARSDFEAAAGQRDPQPYGWLYAHVLQVRLGKMEQARAELRAVVAKLADSKPDEWFLALAAFLLGELDEAALLAEAGKGAASKVRDQRCEARYFAGMARLFAGQQAEAAECFQQSIATGRSNLAEHSFAKAELDILETRPQPTAEPPQPAVPRAVRGRLAAVGQRSFSMRDRETGSIRSFAVNGSTKVTLNGGPASFARLKPAMEVEVVVDANGSARSIGASGRK